MTVKARVAKAPAHRIGRRFLCFLLSVWVHFVAFFCVTTALFHGKNESGLGDSAAIRQPARTIEVTLQATDNRAVTTPTPIIGTETGTKIEPKLDAQPAAQQPQEKIPAFSAAANPIIDSLSTQQVPKTGILGCESLAKKPERIVFGEDYVEFMPDGNPPGYIVLHETIHRDGTVIAVRVENSTMSKKMEDQVLAWAQRSFYHPGEIGGVAVDCDMKYVVSPTPAPPPSDN